MKEKNLHDELFKTTFSMVSEVIAFSKTYLPKWLANQLDYDTLQYEPTSFVGESLSEYFSDIVYSCQFKGGKKLQLTFLLEHKSYLPKNIYIQLLRYLIEIYDSQFKNEKDLTLVIPIVVYHGKDKWKKRTFSDYFDLPDEQLKQYLPTFNYELIDLRQISDDLIIQQSVGHYLKSTFLVFKHKNEKEFIEQFTEEIFIFVNEELNLEQKMFFFRNLLTYIFSAFSFKKDEFKNLVKKINMTSDTINIAEILFGEELEIQLEARLEAERIKNNQQLEVKLEAERILVKKQKIFLQLKNLLNLIKRVPNLKDKEYAEILVGITPLIVKKTKLALSQKKRIDVKKQLLVLFFKDIKIDRADQKQLTKILTDYFKKETKN